jgi:hypothetical protein
MKRKKSDSAIGKVVEADIKTLSKEFKAKTYGELCSIKNALQLKYQEVELVKDALITESKKYEEGVIPQDIVNSIADLFIVLQKIEDRCSLVEVLKSERTLLN